MNIKFFNQGRTLDKDGKVTEDWRDVCYGHDTPYGSISCHDYQRGLLDGSVNPEDLEDLLIQSYFAHQRALGFKIELRIVKRTTTDEVYDA